MFKRLKAIVSFLKEAIVYSHFCFVKDPLVQLNKAFNSKYTYDDILEISEKWCVEHNKPWNRWFIYHDAIHSLLSQGTQILDEGTVCYFQSVHGIVDDHPLSILSISTLAYVFRKEKFLNEIAEERIKHNHRIES